MKLSERIAYLLERSRMSKAELARRCDVTRAASYQWFTGTKQPSLRNAQKIADAFEVPLSDLFAEVRI